MRARIGLLFCWIVLVGCGAAPEEQCEAPAPEVQLALSSIDCSEGKDTGYTSGTAFEITVVTVDGKKVELATANAYYVMAQAAAAAGVNIAIVSGFRTMAEQEYLYGCYVNCSCNSCNLAAKPGYSNHQSGHAVDLNTSSGGVYAWLEANAAAFGFSRTVPSEPWHWEWWGGGPGGGPCGNKPPVGWLDGADCESVKGWSQDPDDPQKGIDVHAYFGGPAGSSAPAKSVVANVFRDDLCAAIGSCEHGFSLRPPLSLLDGQPHAVHAYGIDATGGANAELSGSPGTLACAPPAPSGVRRHVQNPDSLAAWKLDLFWHSLPLDDAAIAELPEGDDLPLTPQLVQADDGSPEVWLMDGEYRRHVPDPAALFAWGFAFSDVQSTPAAEVNALTEGPPLRPAPVLVTSSSGKVDLIDDPFPAPGGRGSGGSGSGTGGSASGGTQGGSKGGSAQQTSVTEADGSCSVGGQSSPTPRAPLWMLFGMLLAFAFRRVSALRVCWPHLIARKTSRRCTPAPSRPGFRSRPAAATFRTGP